MGAYPLPNLKTHSLLDSKYSEYFGVNTEELKVTLENFGLQVKKISLKFHLHRNMKKKLKICMEGSKP